MNPDAYFQTARERYKIRLRRANQGPPPWTEDPVFQKYRFCNVHREHDRVTEWFRSNIRSKLTGLKLVESTMIFRWFNRIETVEHIKDLLLGQWDTEEARVRLENVRPLVTGAYMIKTETGFNKLDGLLYMIDRALPQLADIVKTWENRPDLTIQSVTQDLTAIDGLGNFLAYEIATDLRWTHWLQDAPDIMTWANAGPGCTHGLGRLFGNPWKWKRSIAQHQDQMVTVMQELVKLSRNPKYWPQDWEPWEMRTAEHWACEYDKWCRGTEGERLKRRFHGEQGTSGVDGR